MKALSTLLNGIKSKFQSTTTGNNLVYAVTGGRYLGEFFVFMEDTDEGKMFLSLPSMEQRCVPHDKFLIGEKEKLLDLVESVPNDVYELCKEQYKSINT